MGDDEFLALYSSMFDPVDEELEPDACASTGMPPSVWETRFDEQLAQLTPLIAREYAHDPPRLAATMLAMHRFFARRLARISDATLLLWRERSRAAFDDSPLSMWVYDLDTRFILEANRAARAQYGYTLEEFRSLTVPDLWPEEDYQAVIGYTTAPPRRSNVFGRQKRKDGSIFFIESFGSDYPMPGRRARLAVVKDITQQRVAETRFDRLSQSSVVGIFTIDLQAMRIVDINDSLCSMLGYTREEIQRPGFDWWSITPPEWKAIDDQAVRDLRTTGFAALREKEYFCRDGTRCPVMIASAMVANGEVISCVFDISDRRKMQEAEQQLAIERERARAQEEANRALEEKSEALRQANAELESFSYSVAHDLRAPLRGMDGFAQLVLDTYGGKLDAEGREWLTDIVRNARKMASLIDSLLGLARLTRSEVRPEQVDLSAIARECIAQLRSLEPQRQVQVQLEDGLSARIDPQLARALLDNLLGNAWKFSARSPAPRIEFGREGGEFFVRDNGAGFDMRFAGKLFVPLQRLHAASEFPGTGVGLATIQRIVMRHGGTIRAEGKVNEGATIRFTLPG
jgi:PAS domain S-box-containing protein